MEMKYFIEIGSCDFETNIDLISNGDWRGIMCEPAKKYRENLERLVKDNPYRHNLWIEPVAVSDFDGEVEFAEAKDTSEGNRSIGLWRRGISSVISDNHKGERLFDLPNNAEFIEKKYKVECFTLDTLINRYKEKGFEKIDYLKIDTEGHEINILDSYSWNILPSFIKIEHAHIDDVYAKSLLEARGYVVYTEASDMYAIR